jgi:hypothetical protein
MDFSFTSIIFCNLLIIILLKVILILVSVSLLFVE